MAATTGAMRMDVTIGATSDAEILRRTATRAEAEARILHAQASALVKSAAEMRDLADNLDLASDGE